MTQPVDIEALLQLMERLRDVTAESNCNCSVWIYDQAAIDQTVNALPSLLTELEALRAERGRMKLDLEARDCLQDSAYKAGVKHGWNLCVSDDEDGYQRITNNTAHIAELKRIRADRASIKEPSQ